MGVDTEESSSIYYRAVENALWTETWKTQSVTKFRFDYSMQVSSEEENTEWL